MAYKRRQKKTHRKKPMSRVNRNYPARFINSMLLLALLAFSGIFWAVISSLRSEKAVLEERIDRVNEQIDEEKVRSLRLEDQKIYSHTRAFVEEKARETYGLLYDGEIIFVDSDR